MTDDSDIWDRFYNAVNSDLNPAEHYPEKRPVLAHYTSLDGLEKILSNDELLFSNPLFMNDLEEVKFGLVNGMRAFKESEPIRAALRTPQRHEMFVSLLDAYIDAYDRWHILDTYVFCLSEQNADDRDGILSMWRGYGGNGKGAAIIFDTSKLEPVNGSPMIFAKVNYGSVDERFAWFDKIGSVLAKELEAKFVPDDKIYLPAAALFERTKIFALFTKHSGFQEEKEWRVVYFSEKDAQSKLKHQLSYLNGPRGVEPKLRFKVEPTEGVTGGDLSLTKLISAILLGPSSSSQLTHLAVRRMLELIGKSELTGRLYSSQIPFRNM